MKPNVKSSVAIAAIVTVLCAMVMLVAQGRLFPEAIANGPFAKQVFDGCFLVSLPGFIVAMAIWGYYHEGTIISDLLMIAVNSALYSTLSILFSICLRRWHSRHKDPACHASHATLLRPGKAQTSLSQPF